eukprot:403358951
MSGGGILSGNSNGNNSNLNRFMGGNLINNKNLANHRPSILNMLSGGGSRQGISNQLFGLNQTNQQSMQSSINVVPQSATSNSNNNFALLRAIIQKKKMAEKKRLRRMNLGNQQAVYEFIDRKKHEEGFREGKQSETYFKEISSQPKDFIVQTLGSSVSSFSDLSYYGDDQYQDQSPEQVFTSKSTTVANFDSMPVTRAVSQDNSMLKEPDSAQTALINQDPKFVNLQKAAKKVLITNLLSRQKQQSTNSISSQLQQSNKSLQPKATAMFAPSPKPNIKVQREEQGLLNPPEASTPYGRSKLPPQRAKTTKNKTSTPDIAQQRPNDDTSSNNASNSNSNHGTLKPSSRPSNRDIQKSKDSSRFLTMPLKGTNESFRSKTRIEASPLNGERNTSNTPLGSITGTNKQNGYLKQGSSSKNIQEKNKSMLNSQATKNSRGGKSQSTALNMSHIGNNDDGIPNLNLQKTIKDNQQDVNQLDDSFQKLQLIQDHIEENGLSDQQIINLINKTITPPMEFQDEREFKQLHEEFLDKELLDDQNQQQFIMGSSMQNMSNGNYQNTLLNPHLYKYQQSKLYQEYNQWSEAQNIDNNQDYFTKKLLRTTKPSKYQYMQNTFQSHNYDNQGRQNIYDNNQQYNDNETFLKRRHIRGTSQSKQANYQSSISGSSLINQQSSNGSQKIYGFQSQENRNLAQSPQLMNKINPINLNSSNTGGNNTFSFGNQTLLPNVFNTLKPMNEQRLAQLNNGSLLFNNGNSIVQGPLKRKYHTSANSMAEKDFVEMIEKMVQNGDPMIDQIYEQLNKPQNQQQVK